MRTIAFIVGFGFYLNEAGLQKLANMDGVLKIVILLALGLFLFLDMDESSEKGFRTGELKPAEGTWNDLIVPHREHKTI